MIEKIKLFFLRLFCFLFKGGAEQALLSPSNNFMALESELNTPVQPMKSCKIRVLQSPKSGCSEEEYEDSFYLPFETIDEDQTYCKIAIADGATESSFAKEWAQILTNGFAEHSFSDEEISNTLTELSAIWREKVNIDNLPWYAQEKLKQGAFAAFLGLEIDFSAMQWHSLAIGDCCLFFIRNDELINSFPINNYGEFGNNPYAISSNLNRNSELLNHKKVESGAFESGDIIVLASDALAAWFLKCHSVESKPWKTVIDRFNNGDFPEWLNENRLNNQIKNDDSTFILIEL